MSTAELFKEAFVRAGTKRVAVVGDVMYDEHVFCDVTGLSPEDDLAPKLVVNKRTVRPGGAGNLACNLAALGLQVDLFYVIGDDKEGKWLQAHMQGVYRIASHVVMKGDRPTTKKTRYLTQRNRHVARIDDEGTSGLAKDDVHVLRTVLRQIHDKTPFDSVILSDYGKGVLCRNMLDALGNLPTLKAPKSRAVATGVNGPVVLNEHEDERLDVAGIGVTDHCVPYRVVTRGGYGASLYVAHLDNWHDPVTVPVRKREVGDPTGCGDSFLAAFVAAEILGFSLPDAVAIGNAAGAQAYDHVGVYCVTPMDIVRELTIGSKEN